MNIFKNDNTMYSNHALSLAEPMAWLKILKNTTLVLLIILATVAIVTFFMKGFIFLFGIAATFIFLYYLLIYIGIRIITYKKKYQ